MKSHRIPFEIVLTVLKKHISFELIVHLNADTNDKKDEKKGVCRHKGYLLFGIECNGSFVIEHKTIWYLSSFICLIPQLAGPSNCFQIKILSIDSYDLFTLSLNCIIKCYYRFSNDFK